MDRGAWWIIVHRAAEELDTIEQLNSKQTVLKVVSSLLFKLKY